MLYSRAELNRTTRSLLKPVKEAQTHVTSEAEGRASFR